MSRTKTDAEILSEVRVGDVVECLLHPAGPGTEEYRRAHGHRCDLSITKIDDERHDDVYFDGEYLIKDLEALFAWITMMDGVNDGSQVGETKSIPDIPVNCIERVIERAVPTVNDDIEDAAAEFAEAVAQRRFEREEPGSVLSDEWHEFVADVQIETVKVAERALSKAS